TARDRTAGAGRTSNGDESLPALPAQPKLVRKVPKRKPRPPCQGFATITRSPESPSREFHQSITLKEVLGDNNASGVARIFKGVAPPGRREPAGTAAICLLLVKKRP